MKLGRGVICCLLLACDPFAVEGDGNKETRALSLDDFERVENESELDVHIERGAFDIQVTLDENLQRFVDVWVDSGVLHVETTRWIDYDGVGRVDVVIPRLIGAELSGSGNVEVDAKAGELELELSGSGDVHLIGRASTLSADLSGSGDIEAQDFTVSSADLRLDGSGSIRARVQEHAVVRISGSGNVELWGEADVEVSNSGSGEMIRR